MTATVRVEPPSAVSALSTASLVLVWSGLAAIPFGHFLQQRSPRFEPFGRAQIEEFIRMNPQGPDGFSAFTDGGTGLDVAALAFYALVVGVVFTAGLRLIWSHRRSGGPLVFLLAPLFCAACLRVAAVSFGWARMFLPWGFLTLGSGHLVVALGLVLGGAASMAIAFSPALRQALSTFGVDEFGADF